MTSVSAIADPLAVVLAYVESWRFEAGDPSPSFGEPDLRLANRGGARISAAEIASILERRRAIERSLRSIAPDASLVAAHARVQWDVLRELFDAFAGIHGVGLSKMTKALHPKRPALVPMLDSVVQRYLDAELDRETAFADGAVALVRAYKRELDGNRAVVRSVHRELAQRGHALTEVRILDLLIWSVAA